MCSSWIYRVDGKGFVSEGIKLSSLIDWLEMLVGMKDLNIFYSIVYE